MIRHALQMILIGGDIRFILLWIVTINPEEILMKTNLSVRILLLMQTLTLILAVPTFAEESKTTENIQLEPMTVTATKRETAVEEIPASTNIKDSAFLEKHHVHATENLARFVPNLHFKKATSGNAFVARGISTIDTALVSPMGLYVNDIAYPLSYMQSQLLFDVARVEVLRGPQSTLYGKNSSSGVINVVLPDPGNDFHGKALLEYDSNQTILAGGSARGPIVKDKLFLGLTATFLNTEGYMENQLTGDDSADDQSLQWQTASLGTRADGQCRSQLYMAKRSLRTCRSFVDRRDFFRCGKYTQGRWLCAGEHGSRLPNRQLGHFSLVPKSV